MLPRARALSVVERGCPSDLMRGSRHDLTLGGLLPAAAALYPTPFSAAAGSACFGEGGAYSAQALMDVFLCVQAAGEGGAHPSPAHQHRRHAGAAPLPPTLTTASFTRKALPAQRGPSPSYPRNAALDAPLDARNFSALDDAILTHAPNASLNAFVLPARSAAIRRLASFFSHPSVPLEMA